MKLDNCEYILDSLDKVKLKFDIHNENIKMIKKQAAQLAKNTQDQSKEYDEFRRNLAE